MGICLNIVYVCFWTKTAECLQQRPYELQSQKYLLSAPLQIKFVEPWHKELVIADIWHISTLLQYQQSVSVVSIC